MKIHNNIGSVDRMIRFVFAELFFLGAFFWTSGVSQMILYVFAFAMLITATVRFCGLYTLFGIKTCPIEEVREKVSIRNKIVTGVLLGALLIAGVYGSIFFTKKIFLEDFSSMNQSYKQTLFYTGQNKRAEAVSNYAQLVTSYGIFYEKYATYQPYVLTSDEKFVKDITEVKTKILSLNDMVMTGDLPSAHKEFEMIRPVFQDILKRNGFSLLMVYLVDFHDAMEKVIEPATLKNGEGVLGAYQEADEKLKAVEAIINDEEIQGIRQKLEQVRTSAQNGTLDALPAQASELKSSFVKVYLKRG
jgi:Protein of unknown function (DUF2892)